MEIDKYTTDGFITEHFVQYIIDHIDEFEVRSGDIRLRSDDVILSERSGFYYRGCVHPLTTKALELLVSFFKSYKPRESESEKLITAIAHSLDPWE